jgi:hypothetical protein
MPPILGGGELAGTSCVECRRVACREGILGALIDDILRGRADAPVSTSETPEYQSGESHYATGG